ncbi:MAG: hypothetical protein ACK559_20310, partial [bacterium]
QRGRRSMCIQCSKQHTWTSQNRGVSILAPELEQATKVAWTTSPAATLDISGTFSVEWAIEIDGVTSIANGLQSELRMPSKKMLRV